MLEVRRGADCLAPMGEPYLRNHNLDRSIRTNKRQRMSLIPASNLGFPRMGKRRELKFALEKYWNGESDKTALVQTAQCLRKEHWQLQVEAGIAVPPSNDFSLYDHVLDMTIALGA